MYPQERKYLKPVGTFTFLGAQDVLRADDLVRDTTYQGDPISDYVDHASITHLNWARADCAIPAWVGKTVDEYTRWMSKFGTRIEVMRKAP